MSQGFLPLTEPLSGKIKAAKSQHVTQLAKFAHIESRKENELATGVIQACNIKLSHLYDKLGCLSNSRTRLLPHQIEATHLVVNSLRPRFLLADEVGLGKTIEAGLIIKELMLRKGMSRVLIVLPAPLAIQWQQEMKSKFNEDFEILNRKNFYQFAGNWSNHKRILTSIDFIKNPEYGSKIINTKWDIVIFDEAHRLRRDYSKVTKAWAFADAISKQCDALLLLSATPFRGKLEELFYLIHIIDPHLLGPYHSFVQEFVLPDPHESDSSLKLARLKDKISRVMLRRRKVDVGGFTKRHACTIRFDLTPQERALYDETTAYVKNEYNLAQKEKNRAVSFIMIVFQKLLDSSSRALLRALERRKMKLENRMHTGELFSKSEDVLDEHELEDMLEDWDAPDDVFDELEERSISTIQETRKEIMTLNFLIKLARDVKQDRKLVKLIETINRLKKEGSKKFIIFTQFRTTQDYLAEALSQSDTVTVFHGSLNWKEKEDAIEEFKNSTDILILTEAGGEGRNLQFTNILINYDLPWSPLKIEQRIGRIHRFGQEKDVYIFNFATADTVAERILEILETKIHLFSETIGTPDVLLGNLEDEGMFQKNFMKFISGQKSRKELDDEIEAKEKIAQTGYTKLNDLVTPHCVDFNLNDYYDYTKENRQIDNDRLEKITNEYLKLQIGSLYILQKNSKDKEQPRFSREFESPYLIKADVESAYKPATFISDEALSNPSWEFLALGHPLIEEALQFFLQHPSRHLIRHVKQFRELDAGFCFTFLCEYRNGMKRSEILYCHIDDEQNSLVYENENKHKGQWFRPTQDQKEVCNLDLEKKLKESVRAVEKHAEKKALEIKSKIHTIFKTEEYKLEISFGKKLRTLEEKRDRMKFQHRQNPIASNQALLTRTENEIQKTKMELEVSLLKTRHESQVVPHLTLLQIVCSRN